MGLKRKTAAGRHTATATTTTMMVAAASALLLAGCASAHVVSAGPAAAHMAAHVLGLAPFPVPAAPAAPRRTPPRAASSFSAPSPASTNADDSLIINLGYGIYQGYHNESTRLNVWKGIRFAAPPVGDLRWQAPRLPDTDHTIAYANAFGPQCPQSPPAVAAFPPELGSEDCLFLNVYAPADDSNTTTSSSSSTSKKPVLVWIHGGGYGMGNGQSDLTGLVNANDNGFVGVSIQYRLGAFGFLASAAVRKNGIVNAGLLDQAYALMWVQNYIGLFGGDPARVTIAGESAGGGSVMYHTLANGGTPHLQLFDKAIAASPYLVPQYDFAAPEPTRRFAAFARAAGCNASDTGDDDANDTAFACLVAADTHALQNASARVSAAGTYATWAFVPVTDGAYVRQRASAQLARGAVHGTRLLVGNNADEGTLFVPANVSSAAGLRAWIATTFPGLSATNVTALLAAYGGNTNTTAYSGPLVATNGVDGPTADDVSQAAAGPQQRAYNMYAEATFVCPAYWLAEAFTRPANQTSTTDTTASLAYQYEYAVPFASHGSDVSAYLGPAAANQGPDLVQAFRRIWGGFVLQGDPSGYAANATGGGGDSSSVNNTTSTPWRPWSPTKHTLLSLNQTGGHPVTVNGSWGGPSVQLHGPGLRNAFRTADADAWEGGRGARCAFWRTVAAYLPQ
ncbi:Carboxylesterase, type B [Niveomyces insectorum RCEF 264]|uniref:Carboxylic ester hydrolase n=1 Tax=Niveomyces insectorum RCEF 264 TaxID=1081102 RepID=A0A167SFR8_9HYPO|nr:Carboxylesterase, type B [Niveomyces insectorum RCEF 264]